MAQKYCHRSQQCDKMTDKMTDNVTKKRLQTQSLQPLILCREILIDYFSSFKIRIAASRIAVSSNVTTPPSGPCSI